MVLTPLVYELILQFAPLDLIVYMRIYIDKLMFSLSSDLLFDQRTENGQCNHGLIVATRLVWTSLSKPTHSN
jgi:hypothetical protein